MCRDPLSSWWLPGKYSSQGSWSLSQWTGKHRATQATGVQVHKHMSLETDKLLFSLIGVWLLRPVIVASTANSSNLVLSPQSVTYLKFLNFIIVLEWTEIAKIVQRVPIPHSRILLLVIPLMKRAHVLQLGNWHWYTMTNQVSVFRDLTNFPLRVSFLPSFLPFSFFLLQNPIKDITLYVVIRFP